MSVVDDATARTYYPARTQVQSGTPNGFGKSTTAADSPFADSNKVCILYRINYQTNTAGAGALLIQTHAGSTFMGLEEPTGNIRCTVDFGPEGVRLPAGFRVVTPGTTITNFEVIYEVV
jgi:hypothetical protein